MSGTDQTAAALFRAGKLDDAIAAAQAALRKAPTDLDARVLLGELLAFAGNLERADVVLDAASAIDPGTALVVAEFRQLIRADMARRQLFRDGRVPEFLADPTETQRLHSPRWWRCAPAIWRRQRSRRPPPRRCGPARCRAARRRGIRRLSRRGRSAGRQLRGADHDRASISGSRPSASLTLEFHAPHRPRDLLWRRASMSVDRRAGWRRLSAGDLRHRRAG